MSAIPATVDSVAGPNAEPRTGTATGSPRARRTVGRAGTRSPGTGCSARPCPCIRGRGAARAGSGWARVPPNAAAGAVPRPVPPIAVSEYGLPVPDQRPARGRHEREGLPSCPSRATSSRTPTTSRCSKRSPTRSGPTLPDRRRGPRRQGTGARTPSFSCSSNRTRLRSSRGLVRLGLRHTGLGSRLDGGPTHPVLQTCLTDSRHHSSDLTCSDSGPPLSDGGYENFHHRRASTSSPRPPRRPAVRRRLHPHLRRAGLEVAKIGAVGGLGNRTGTSPCDHAVMTLCDHWGPVPGLP